MRTPLTRISLALPLALGLATSCQAGPAAKPVQHLGARVPKSSASWQTLSPIVKFEVLTNGNGDFRGIGRVEIQGITVRSGESPFSVSSSSPNSSRRSAFKLTSSKRDPATGEIVLSTRRGGPGGQPERIDWRLSPETWNIGGKQAHGLSYRFEYWSDKHPIYSLKEQSSWCLGGGIEGLRYLDQSDSYARGSRDILIDKNTEIKAATPLDIKVTAESRQANGDYMDFLTGKQRSLVRFVSEPSLTFRDIWRKPGQNELQASEEYATPLAQHFVTPRMTVLLYPQGGVNAWFAVRDAVTAKLRQKANIQPARPLPWVNLIAFDIADWVPDSEVPKRLDFYQKMGFKRLWKWSQWQTNWTEWDSLSEEERTLGVKSISHSVLKLDFAKKISPFQLKELCQGATQRDMNVIMWFPTAHLSPASPLLKEHPDWIVRNPDGSPFHYAYPELVGIFHPAGYSEYALGRLRELKREIGFGGVYFDSAQVFGYDVIQYGDPRRPNQFSAMLDFSRQLERSGLTVMSECQTPFNIAASSGFYTAPGKEPGDFLKSDSNVPPYLFYKTSPHCGGAKIVDPLRYFQLVAFMAPPLVPETVWWQNPALQKLGSYVNHAYNNRVAQMEHCTMLPGDQGTLWWDKNGTSGTLFAFKSGWVDLGQKATEVKEVETSHTAKLIGSRVWIEAYKVYAVQK